MVPGGIIHWRVMQTGSVVDFTPWVVKKAESSFPRCQLTVLPIPVLEEEAGKTPDR